VHTNPARAGPLVEKLQARINEGVSNVTARIQGGDWPGTGRKAVNIQKMRITVLRVFEIAGGQHGWNEALSTGVNRTKWAFLAWTVTLI
jgi:hypothetical protein